MITTTPTNCAASLTFTEIVQVSIAAVQDEDESSSGGGTSSDQDSEEVPSFLEPGAFWVGGAQPVEVYAGTEESVTLPEIACLLLDPCNWEVFVLDSSPDYVTLDSA